MTKGMQASQERFSVAWGVVITGEQSGQAGDLFSNENIKKRFKFTPKGWFCGLRL